VTTPRIALPAILSLLSLSASIAKADSVVMGFDNISANRVADATTGEAQLSVTMTDLGFNVARGKHQVEFRFANSGPNASSITDVYFDDGTLFGIASITDSGSGVSFSQGASPGDLPSGNSLDPDFETSQGFLADSDPAAQPNGVNPGEWLAIVFDLLPAKNFQSVKGALLNPDPSQGDSLRIGIHVQGFARGGSETFVNTPPDDDTGTPSAVPEPSSLALLSIATLAMMGYPLRRRRKPDTTPVSPA
jgi:hypothetical protein